MKEYKRYDKNAFHVMECKKFDTIQIVYGFLFDRFSNMIY